MSCFASLKYYKRIHQNTIIIINLKYLLHKINNVDVQRINGDNGRKFRF